MKLLSLILVCGFLSSCCNCFQSSPSALDLLNNNLQGYYQKYQTWPKSFKDFTQNDIVNQQPLSLINDWGLWQSPKFTVLANQDLLIEAQEYFSPDTEIQIKKLRLTITPHRKGNSL